MQLYVSIFRYIYFFLIPNYEEKNEKPGGGQMDPHVEGELYIVTIPLTVKEGGLGGDKGM